ncbi:MULTISPECIES: hypothetical protein [Burkholderiaceae]|uniref:hypothetical protein n=1 Tax=Burkholderiaceae TaxID=119060 RepID=UPI0011133E36|nr:hypothetical protein [Ralstonia sp. 25mfcol4.1]
MQRPLIVAHELILNYLRGEPEGEIQGHVEWRKALELMCSAPRSPHFSNYESVLGSCEDERALATAVQYLKKVGYDINFAEGELKISDDEERKLATDIDSLVATVGGRVVLDCVFHQINHLFDPRFQRYRFVRKTSQWNHQVNPQQPFGYLINLAVKHWHLEPKETNLNLLDKIQHLSTAYSALHEVQPYNPYSSLFVDTQNIINFLQRSVRYDSLFSIFQLRVTDAKILYKGLLRKHISSRTTIRGIGVAEVIRLTDFIIDRHCRGNFKIPFSAKSIAQERKMRESTVRKIIDTVLAHEPHAANKDYLLAANVDLVNFQDRPLLKQKNGTYQIISPSICGPAFVTSLLQFASGADSNFYADLGRQAEHLLREKLTAHGITWHTGEYSSVYEGRLEKGECDIVIETKDVVFFLETKNKTLTNLARSGSDLHLFTDLALGAVHAASQIIRHELLLKSNGTLTLKDGDLNHTVHLNNRHVERISISLPEFGALQDRIILDHLLNAFLRADFSTNSGVMKKQFSQANKIAQSLRNSCAGLAKLGADTTRMFFSNWHLSFAQLCVLLDRVKSNEDFKSELWRTRNIVTGTHDWYHDQSHMIGLYENVTASTDAG